MKIGSIVAVIFIGIFSICHSTTYAQAYVDELVDAEREFAAYCGENGIPEAWLAYFSEEGIVFEPHPKNAHEANRSKIPSPTPASSKLYWEPYHGAVSIVGDIGFNTGPWKITSSNNQSTGTQYGYFFSVWKKNPSGEWKVLLDLGIPIATAGPEHVFGAEYDERKKEADYGKSKAESLEEADYIFNVTAANGLKSAYQKLASTGLLSTISGFHPFYNKRTFLSWISSDASPYLKASGIFSTIDSGVASSQEIGYSYGSYEINGLVSEKGYFIRIWRRNTEGYWYLSAEVLSDNVKRRT